MKIKISNKIKAGKGALIAPIFVEDLNKTPDLYPLAIRNFIKERVKNDKFDGKDQGHVSFLSEKGLPSHLFLVGAAAKADFTATIARNLGGRVGKQVKCMKNTEVTVLLPRDLASFIGQFLEGYIMSQYDEALFKTDKKKENYNTELLHLVMPSVTKSAEQAVEKAELIAKAANYVRRLINSPANIVDSEYLTAEAKRIAKDNRHKKALLGLRDLKKMKAGGILAVNQGCKREPRMLVLEYNGGSRKEKPIVIIGKGVVFDTGGYNLKTAPGMEQMNQDMAGAATVLAIMDLVKKLKIKKNIIGIMPVVENLVNEDAYRPSDIITMLSGTTVEITNTDAEGRLILADAIHYATELKPEAIITIATLTGASFAALGHRYCALVSNNDQLRDQLQAISHEVDDLAWALPIHEDYRKEMESKIADLRNHDSNSGGGAGCTKAAAFLEKFVKNNKWCHIDIGGTAYTSRPKPYETKGATSHGLRMLIKFLES